MLRRTAFNHHVLNRLMNQQVQPLVLEIAEQKEWNALKDKTVLNSGTLLTRNVNFYTRDERSPQFANITSIVVESDNNNDITYAINRWTFPRVECLIINRVNVPILPETTLSHVKEQVYQRYAYWYRLEGVFQRVFINEEFLGNHGMSFNRQEYENMLKCFAKDSVIIKE
jgi:hypothetical protein